MRNCCKRSFKIGLGAREKFFKLGMFIGFICGFLLVIMGKGVNING